MIKKFQSNSDSAVSDQVDDAEIQSKQTIINADEIVIFFICVNLLQ